MKVLRFGKSGRLARIAQRACEAAYPNVEFCTQQRSGGYLQESTDVPGQFHPSLQSCMQAWQDSPVVVIDASVDHSGIESLLQHEAQKRDEIVWLERRGLLAKAVGFSSGIALLDLHQIDSGASHMLAYRAQKRLQQELFAKLRCPSFQPNLFTLVGPITYSRQSAAWAQILRARLAGTSDLLLHEPLVRRFWVSEQRVFTLLLGFLRGTQPASIAGALVDGVFCLADVAVMPLGVEVPPLDYLLGNQRGWLRGDYVVDAELANPQLFAPELLRALCC